MDELMTTSPALTDTQPGTPERREPKESDAMSNANMAVVPVPRELAKAWTDARRSIQASPNHGPFLRDCIRTEVDLASFIEEQLEASPLGGGQEDQGSSAEGADTHRATDGAVVAAAKRLRRSLRLFTCENGFTEAGNDMRTVLNFIERSAGK